MLPLSKATVVLANTLSYVSHSLQSQLPWPPFLEQISQSFFEILLGPVPADGIVNSAVLVTLGAHGFDLVQDLYFDRSMLIMRSHLASPRSISVSSSKMLGCLLLSEKLGPRQAHVMN